VVKRLCTIFDIDSECEDLREFREELKSKISKEKMLMFLDMFEFWHKALKKI
jgi:hypothetical protein